MAAKDITEKKLEAYNDVFADIINNLVFDGEEVVKSSDLADVQPHSYYSAESQLVREQERDVAKVWKNLSVRIAYFGLENETAPEDDMPYRVIGYDGAAYRDQIRYTKDEKGNRVKVIDRYPVSTLVLYLGYEKQWDKATTIYEVFGDRLDERLKKIVPDYPINLYEIAFLSREQVDRFHSDFWILADYLYQMRTTGEYVPTDYEMDHVREVLKMLEAVTEDKRFTEYIDEFEKSKEAVTMCKVLDEVQAKGEQNATNLINYLWENGRSEDAKKAAKDKNFFNQLLTELMPVLTPAK